MEVEQFGADTEVVGLRRDMQALVNELLKLRQEQQKSRGYLQSMEHKLQGTERNQKQMMNFLARSMQNPAFAEQLLQHKEKKSGPLVLGASSNGEKFCSVNGELVEFGFQASSKEALALEMQGVDKVLDEMFFEELLNARVEEELDMEDGDEED